MNPLDRWPCLCLLATAGGILACMAWIVTHDANRQPAGNLACWTLIVCCVALGGRILDGPAHGNENKASERKTHEGREHEDRRHGCMVTPVHALLPASKLPQGAPGKRPRSIRTTGARELRTIGQEGMKGTTWRNE